MPPSIQYPYNIQTGVKLLRERDARLARLIDRVGPYALPLRPSLSPFQALLRAIVGQQLSGQAARAIYTRLADHFPRRRPSAKRLLALSEHALRETGLSRAKVRAVRDLALRFHTRSMPGKQAMARLDDDEIIARLTQIRGVGRWTVEMMLIFNLGRADVMAATDLGIRKGLAIAYDLDSPPPPATVLEIGRRWRPYRSMACWYLWRANEL